MRSWSPGARGFERFHGFLGAETSQWYPDLVHDNHPVEQPTMPEDGYHFSTDITDKALEFIGDVKAIAPDRPVFLYYAPGRAHAPRQVPREWIERYRGRFDAGDEALREQTMARRKETGLLPQNTELPPLNPIGTPRAALARGERHSRHSTTPGPGTLSPTTRSGSSPGWQRCTPGSSPTATT
ncbi:sulfatase-like hydrolase/transferase [Streptomyces canus]|uniref:sulfatase-like hydrolase/transferase n=1 Tax=Streptomyces canus TaxID=58343 RepID=UPI0027802AB5|nr:sulfatase-like hydrolase/transferase [Streptomyces canus]MDQ1073268.1 arylsulfatase A-like enzyme [Streptomyces canus]